MRTVAGIVLLSCVVVALCHDNHDHSYHQPAYNNPDPEPASVAAPEPAPSSGRLPSFKKRIDFSMLQLSDWQAFCHPLSPF